MSYEIEGGKLITYLPDPVDVVVPEGVTEIGSAAFAEANIKTIKLPKSLRVIKDHAFWNCKRLMRVEFSDGLVEIERSAFENCTRLVTMNIPSSIQKIGVNAFVNTPWLNLKHGFNIVGNGILVCYHGPEKHIIIPEQVKQIGRFAFSGNQLIEEVTCNDGLEIIEAFAFSGCHKLKKINLPNKMQKIRHNAFSQTGIERIIIPNGIVKISDNVFSRCYDLEEVILPPTVLKLCHQAFEGCHNLVKINLNPNTTIESDAFNECVNLKF